MCVVPRLEVDEDNVEGLGSLLGSDVNTVNKSESGRLNDLLDVLPTDALVNEWEADAGVGIVSESHSGSSHFGLNCVLNWYSIDLYRVD